MDQEPIKRTSRIAVASLLCIFAAIGSEILFALFLMVGLDCGEFVVTSMRFCYAAAILAIVAIAWITFRRRILKGYICAIVAIILCVPFIWFDYEVRCGVKARQQRKKEWTGLYNLELLGKELLAYANDHNGCLPVADKWCDELMEYNPELSKENFMHPQHPKLPKENYKFTPPDNFPDIFDFKGQCQFAFNKNISGMLLADIPSDVVLLFEADGDWNLNGTEELLKTRYREHGYITILFVDQTTGNYWFYENAVRKFGPKGKHMYDEKPRWKP
jgi:hypothetical protein